MSDLENLEQRVGDIERRLDDALNNRMIREAAGEPEPPKHIRGTTARIFFGLLIVVLGFLWLGKSYGIDWLQRIELWPLVVIAIGLAIIFGDRGR